MSKPQFDCFIFVGFFYGAQVNGHGGACFFLNLQKYLVFKLKRSIGEGNNTRAELLVLWGLLGFSHRKGLHVLHIVGDSKVVINWILGSSNLNVVHLSHLEVPHPRLKGLFSLYFFLTYLQRV